uniref:DUF7745 domain-containing protein n=1 Tax=Cajanus cajan TaxID=3821 RepID=A0A151QPE1_CAJCA|nr:hypothetical protein KK1_047198 [Cajanus cajan]
MRALIHFWKSELHYFELPHLDIVPTIEEYDLMIKWPKSEGVYIIREKTISIERVAKLIKFPPHI